MVGGGGGFFCGLKSSSGLLPGSKRAVQMAQSKQCVSVRKWPMGREGCRKRGQVKSSEHGTREVTGRVSCLRSRVACFIVQMAKVRPNVGAAEAGPKWLSSGTEGDAKAVRDHSPDLCAPPFCSRTRRCKLSSGRCARCRLEEDSAPDRVVCRPCCGGCGNALRLFPATQSPHDWPHAQVRCLRCA